jgi:hypothetical protein
MIQAAAIMPDDLEQGVPYHDDIRVRAYLSSLSKEERIAWHSARVEREQRPQDIVDTVTMNTVIDEELIKNYHATKAELRLASKVKAFRQRPEVAIVINRVNVLMTEIRRLANQRVELFFKGNRKDAAVKLRQEDAYIEGILELECQLERYAEGLKFPPEIFKIAHKILEETRGAVTKAFAVEVTGSPF